MKLSEGALLLAVQVQQGHPSAGTAHVTRVGDTHTPLLLTSGKSLFMMARALPTLRYGITIHSAAPATREVCSRSTLGWW
jgi:hypothetical protein